MELYNELNELDYEENSDYEEDFNEDNIYAELSEIENLELDEKGTCVDCGNPNGTLRLDPNSQEIYGEPKLIHLCSACSDDFSDFY